MKAADVSFRSFSVWENHRDRCHAMPHLHCPPRLATKNVEFTIGFQWGKVTPLWLGLVIIINHLIYYHLLLLIDFWASPIPTTNKFVSVQYVSALYESNILSSSDMYVYIYISLQLLRIIFYHLWTEMYIPLVVFLIVDCPLFPSISPVAPMPLLFTIFTERCKRWNRISTLS